MAFFTDPREIRRIPTIYHCDHDLPWGFYPHAQNYYLSPQPQPFEPRHSSTTRRRAKGICWVWPNDGKRGHSTLHRLADIFRNQGPDMFICDKGKRPKQNEWINPSSCKRSGLWPTINRDGYKYNKHSRTYKRQEGSTERRRPRRTYEDFDWYEQRPGRRVQFADEVGLPLFEDPRYAPSSRYMPVSRYPQRHW
jgi:hypothetical protein